MFTTLLGGFSFLWNPNLKPARVELVLVFVGSYLFSIVVLHLLPDLFAQHVPSPKVSTYILLGFFLQLFLSFFSKGIEHGHMYETWQPSQESRLSTPGLLIALCIHALLDGTILTNAIAVHPHHAHTTNKILIGIMLHKAFDGLALVSVLSKLLHNTKKVSLYLVFFSLVSPIGLCLGKYCGQQFLLSPNGFTALTAIATGSLLHIATIILFETVPHQGVNFLRFIVSLGGAGLVLVLEYLH